MNIPHFENCFVCGAQIKYTDFGSFFCDEKSTCFWGRDVEEHSSRFISIRWQINKDYYRVICFDYYENRVRIYLGMDPSSDSEILLPFVEASLENYQRLKIEVPKLLLL